MHGVWISFQTKKWVGQIGLPTIKLKKISTHHALTRIFKVVRINVVKYVISLSP